MKKKNFRFGQIVKISDTNSELDGEVVEIVGVAVEHVVDTYIVLMQRPKETTSFRMGKFLALVMPEGHLTAL